MMYAVLSLLQAGGTGEDVGLGGKGETVIEFRDAISAAREMEDMQRKKKLVCIEITHMLLGVGCELWYLMADFPICVGIIPLVCVCP